MKSLSVKELNQIKCPCCGKNMTYHPDIMMFEDDRKTWRGGENPKIACNECNISMRVFGVDVSDYQSYLENLEKERIKY